MRYRVLSLVLLAVLGSACAGGVTSFERADPKGVYRSEEDVFCLKVPPDWDIRERFEGATVVFLSPLSSTRDSFRENLIVRVEELPREISSQDYRQQKLEHLASEVKGYQLVEEGDTEGRAWAVYRHRMVEPELQVLAFFDVHTAEGKTRGYLMAFTTPASDFAEWEPEFRAIALDLVFDLSRCPEVTPTPGGLGTPTWVEPTPAGTESPSAGTPAVEASPGETPAVGASPAAATPRRSP